jgi:hypothetical protein
MAAEHTGHVEHHALDVDIRDDDAVAQDPGRGIGYLIARIGDESGDDNGRYRIENRPAKTGAGPRALRNTSITTSERKRITAAAATVSYLRWPYG